jgi:hypothetical protein
MVMVIWAAVAEVIITDGAEGAVIITAGTAVDIAITTEIQQEAVMCRPPGPLCRVRRFLATGSGIENRR